MFQSQPVETRRRWEGEEKEKKEEAVRRSCWLPTQSIDTKKTLFHSRGETSDGTAAGPGNNNTKQAAFERGEAQRRRGEHQQAAAAASVRYF